MSHKICIWWIFFFTPILFTARVGAQNSPERSIPERSIHGQRLAYHVAKLALSKYGNLMRQESSIKLDLLLGTLYTGSDFTSIANQNRWRLEQWMLQRPDQSITPLQLMTQSLQLTSGNVQDALILCWDTLREHWIDSKYRNLFPRSLKLADITGELLDFDGNDQMRDKGPIKTIRGDNFSAWYHFFGTAINAYIASKKMTSMPAGIYARLMIYLEENWFHDEFIDSKKRIAIDNAGSAFGLTLSKLLKRYSSFAQFDQAWRQEAAKGSYITSDPEVFDERWSLKENQHPRDFGTNHSTKTAQSLMAQAVTMLNQAKARNTASTTMLGNYLNQNGHELAKFAATLLATFPHAQSPQQSFELLFNKINYGQNHGVIATVIEQILLSKHISEQQKLTALQKTRMLFRQEILVEVGVMNGMSGNLDQSMAEKTLISALTSNSSSMVRDAAAHAVFARQAKGLAVSSDLLNEAQEAAQEIHTENQNRAVATFRMKAFKDVCRSMLLHLSGLN